MRVESWMLAITAVLLLWNKALDVISTYRHIATRGETNPLAQWLFRKLGLRWALVAVSLVYIAIIALSGAIIITETNPVVIYSVVITGLFVSAVQFDVARANTTGKHSTLTKMLVRLFSQLRFG